MASLMGSKGNPYTFDAYQILIEQRFWNGGWVLMPDEGVVYITTNYMIEKDNEDGEIGSNQNPFSEMAYSEMMNAQTWPGGYVQHVCQVEYHYSFIEQLYASGSGSYSASGSELGSDILPYPAQGSVECYVRAGVEDMLSIESGGVKVTLSWSSGYTQIIPYSYLYFRVHLGPSFEQVSNTLSAQWDHGYVVRLSGRYEYRRKDGNPTNTHSIIDPIFEIPECYRGRYV